MNKKKKIQFGSGATDFYFASSISRLKEITEPRHTVLITDSNIQQAHARRFKPWRVLVLEPGEKHKKQATVDRMVQQLIDWEVDRKTVLVGVGGGVVTDITGYLASVYMRGLRFGFLPTSLLALVDASIGGKNGVDVGDYKNLVGVIRQPNFILHDMAFLRSLPETEWRNGFAEIIKHACIRDAALFRELETLSLRHFQKRQKSVCDLVQRNALLKAKVVQADETEQGDRRLLNFGHTLGHAIETKYNLMHGEAVAIGMNFAARLSEKLLKFKEALRVEKLIERYGLPAKLDFDRERTFEILKMDKKRERAVMNYVLLEKLGKGKVKAIEMDRLREFILTLS
ncbi:MAG: 3-dehydroquinate synthase [Chitinophagaceae bacterium]